MVVVSDLFRPPRGLAAIPRFGVKRNVNEEIVKPEQNCAGLFIGVTYVHPMIKIASKSAPSVKIAFYLSQAEECGKAAETATLQNVRDRSLRYEAAWRKMAGDIDGGTPSTPPEVATAGISTSTPAFASFA